MPRRRADNETPAATKAEYGKEAENARAVSDLPSALTAPAPSLPSPSGHVHSVAVIELLSRIAAAVEGGASPEAPEGLRAEAAAAFIGVSRSAFYELDSRGLVPRGVQIGDSTVKVFLRSELKAWLRAAPPRAPPGLKSASSR